MNIWCLEVKNFGKLPLEVGDDVLQNTVQKYVIGTGTVPLVAFGIVPTSLAVRRGFIWVELTPAGRSAPQSAWRQMRRAFPQFISSLGWSLFAFAKSNEQVEQRFMRFFGFKEFASSAEHVFYERSA